MNVETTHIIPVMNMAICREAAAGVMLINTVPAKGRRSRKKRMKLSGTAFKTSCYSLDHLPAGRRFKVDFRPITSKNNRFSITIAAQFF